MWWVEVCCLWRGLPEAVTPLVIPTPFRCFILSHQQYKTTVRTRSTGWPALLCAHPDGSKFNYKCILESLWGSYMLGGKPSDTSAKTLSHLAVFAYTDQREDMLLSSILVHYQALTVAFVFLSRTIIASFSWSWTESKCKVALLPASLTVCAFWFRHQGVSGQGDLWPEMLLCVFGLLFL